MKGTITIADLFCGAGGTSTGAVEAIELLGKTAKLTAINHWDVAIATHSKNHPSARHFCASLDNINPRDLFKEAQLDILWASPECTHHSVARGGKPINDQSRSTAWCVTRWAEALRPPVILVENVPDFLTWGPIGSNGRPIASRKGEVFHSWCGTLEALGYRVEHRILVAADFGDPTTRPRLFVQAVRGKRKIVWPAPTHAAKKTVGMVGTRKVWIPARDIIDWNLPSKSIFTRKHPLAPKTMRRIWAGLLKFGLIPPTTACLKNGATTPYIVELRGTKKSQLNHSAKDISEPLSTVTTSGAHHYLVEPFMVAYFGDHSGKEDSAKRVYSINNPIGTLTTENRYAVAHPYLVEYYGTGKARSIDTPLNTVTCKERHALVQPIISINEKKYLLDIHFRMLQPKELAAAQGFRSDYIFAGNKTEQVKQIGNAVPRNLARAIVLAALSQNADISKF